MERPSVELSQLLIARKVHVATVPPTPIRDVQSEPGLLATLTVRLHPASGGAKPSRAALRAELLPAHETGRLETLLNDAVTPPVET